MTDRNLTVARLVEDEIESVEIEDAFGDLLDSLGIAPKVENRAIVTSAQHGGDDTRAYIVSVHTVPGAGLCLHLSRLQVPSGVRAPRGDSRRPRGGLRARRAVQARR
jgi:hypothetical protein